jgi:hypothetical protein
VHKDDWLMQKYDFRDLVARWATNNEGKSTKWQCMHRSKRPAIRVARSTTTCSLGDHKKRKSGGYIYEILLLFGTYQRSIKIIESSCCHSTR